MELGLPTVTSYPEQDANDIDHIEEIGV
jgi:hypothetical protein